MKVFVTGGGGFLGQVIVEQLLEKGHEIHTYSRNESKALNKPGVTQFQGNLTDYEVLHNAMKGCEAVFHIAAKTGIQGTYSSFYDTNVTGTKNIVKACIELKIPHLIYTSSASVAYSGNSEGKNETLPYPKKFDAYYPKTKAIAEKFVLDANGLALTTCSLRPHLVWGPNDPHFLPRLLDRRRKDKLRVLGSKDYRVDITYVDNAAKAHLKAFDAMRSNPISVGGKPYFLSQDEPINVRDFIDRLLDSDGLKPVEKTLNPKVARFLGWLIQSVFRLFKLKNEPPLTLFVAKQLSSSHWYDISAAKNDFGYTPTVSTDEGMKRLKEWNKHMV
tara:strand:- start:1429 stop:2421 length:993 start_codon:yes stop_codon:yes gene_type:complete